MFGKKISIMVEVIKKEYEGSIYKIVFKEKLEMFTLEVDSKSYEKISVRDYGELTMKNGMFKRFTKFLTIG